MKSDEYLRLRTQEHYKIPKLIDKAAKEVLSPDELGILAAHGEVFLPWSPNRFSTTFTLWLLQAHDDIFKDERRFTFTPYAFLEDVDNMHWVATFLVPYPTNIHYYKTGIVQALSNANQHRKEIIGRAPRVDVLIPSGLQSAIEDKRGWINAFGTLKIS